MRTLGPVCLSWGLFKIVPYWGRAVPTPLSSRVSGRPCKSYSLTRRSVVLGWAGVGVWCRKDPNFVVPAVALLGLTVDRWKQNLGGAVDRGTPPAYAGGVVVSCRFGGGGALDWGVVVVGFEVVMLLLLVGGRDAPENLQSLSVDWTNRNGAGAATLYEVPRYPVTCHTTFLCSLHNIALTHSRRPPSLFILTTKLQTSASRFFFFFAKPVCG